MLDREGIDEVAERLGALSKGVSRILGAGLRAEMKVIAAGIAAAAPRGDGRVVQHNQIDGGGLGNSIGMRQKKSRGEIVMAKVGIGVAKTQAAYGVPVSKGASSVPYGHLVAAGTSERFTGSKSRVNKKTGKVKLRQTGNPVQYRGRVIGNNFVERGYMATREAAEAAGLAKIEEGIRKEIARGP